MPQITLHAGFDCGKPLLREYAARVRNGNRCLWITGVPGASGLVRRQLVDDTLATLSPGVCSPEQLSSQLLAAIDEPAVSRPLDQAMSRQLLSEIVDQHLSASRLEHYGRLEPRGALIDLLAVEINSVATRGMSPAKLLAQAGTADSPRQREFAGVYRDYCKAVEALGAVDRVGRLRRATQALRHPACESIGWRYVVLTLTGVPPRVERDFLAAVLTQTDEAAITLPVTPWEPGDTLNTTVDWLEDSVGSVHVDRELSPEKRPEEIEFLDTWLFRDPAAAPEPPAEDSPTTSAVRLLAGDSAQDEVDLVAREIKHCLLAGVSADEIVITAPAPRVIARRLTDACRSLGVPLAVDVAPWLGEAPAVRTLLAVLALHKNDWRHDEVLRVLTSPTLHCFDDSRTDAPSNRWEEARAAGLAGPRAAAELAIRRLLLPRGRQQLEEQIEREIIYAERVAETTANRRSERELISYRCAADAVALIGESLDDLPSKATPLDWFDALRGLLDRLRYAVSRDEKDSTTEIDLAGLDVLEDALASLERLSRWRGKRPPLLSLDEVAHQLADWAPRLRLDASRDTEGRVRLLSIDTAIAEKPRHLFVSGLAEGALPRPLPPADPFADMTPALRESHQQDEMRRFHQLATSATESLTLAYAALDSKAQPLNPSSFVAEVERLFLPRSLKIETPRDEPLSAVDLRRQALKRLNAGDASGLRELATQRATAARAPAVLDGAEATLLRAAGDSFGSNEGVLTGDAARRAFAERYGPEHLWSPSQLELYAECPFKFFMRHGLGVEPLDPLRLGIDYRRRGSLLHDAMVRFHQAVGEEAPGLSDEEFLARFDEAITTAENALPVVPHERSLMRVEAKQAVAWAPRYREQLTAYRQTTGGLDSPMEPAFFEARFGPRHSAEETDATLSTDEPFRLPIGGEELLLAGRIDRIDLASVDGQTVFNVVDYKTPKEVKASVEAARSGRQLQLFLYALATERLLLADRDAAPWQVGYWEVQDKGFKPPKENKKVLSASEASDAGVQPTEEWRTLEGEVIERLRTIVAGIRRGEFPMYNEDENCAGRCEFAGVCRVSQARGVGKLPPCAPTSSEQSTMKGDAK